MIHVIRVRESSEVFASELPLPNEPAGQPSPAEPTLPSPAEPTLPSPAEPTLPEPLLADEQRKLIGDLRQLWMRLAIWSRSLIVSTVAGLGDITQLTDRLLAVPEEFSAILGQYFEPQEADQFRELLEEFLSTSTALIAAEKNKDDNLVNQETKNLYADADRIAEYLVSINSNWSQEQWTDLLNDWIEMLLADLVARLDGDYAKEITVFADLENQSLKSADYMADGIMKKFHP